MKISIKNGRVIDPASGLDAVQDIYIAAGRIVAMGAMPERFHANTEIDADGLVVCPGLVDLSVRLREPGLEYKATLESEMHAAAVGGITSLACPPDTDPPLDEPGLVEMLKFRAKNSPGPRVYPIGALTWKLQGERLTEMAELNEAGCVAFSQADAPIIDTLVLLRAMEYAYSFGFPIWLRPQDYHLARDGVVHDGIVSARYGLPSIPVPAETVALQTILLLVRETGARVHLCRLSSRAAVEMVRKAKEDGLPVTCDVGIHHVHLSEMDTTDFNANCHDGITMRKNWIVTRHVNALFIAGTRNVLCEDNVIRTLQVANPAQSTSIPKLVLATRVEGTVQRNVTPAAIDFRFGTPQGPIAGLNTNVVSATATPAALPRPEPCGPYNF